MHLIQEDLFKKTLIRVSIYIEKISAVIQRSTSR